MNRSLCRLLVPPFLAVAAAAFAQQPRASTAPPAANRIEHKEVRHGETVVDPYFWLREKTNPEVTKYLEAENAYTEAMTKDLEAVPGGALQGDARLASSRPT